MSRVARSALGLLALLVLPGTAQAQALPSATPIDAWGPSGTVNAIARAGDTLYVGGDFDYVGPATGPFVVLDSATGESFPVAGVTGRVDRVASVPGGGWILAGSITLAGQASPNRQLVRVDASGGVIPSWFATFSGSLGFLAADTSAVYLGGFIYQVNGAVREGIAAVDLATGALLPWDPVLDNGQPTASVDEGLLYQGAVFLRGSFSSVGGQPAAGFAALDAPTAALRPSSTAPVSQVRAMSATGGTLYVTGYDNSLVWAGASMAIATGVATRWNVPSGFYIDGVGGHQPARVRPQRRRGRGPRSGDRRSDRRALLSRGLRDGHGRRGRQPRARWTGVRGNGVVSGVCHAAGHARASRLDPCGQRPD